MLFAILSLYAISFSFLNKTWRVVFFSLPALALTFDLLAFFQLFCFLVCAEAQKLPYYASYGRVRLAIHTLCTSHYLDLVITFIICINVITMSLEHYSQPQVTSPVALWMFVVLRVEAVACFLSG